MTVGVFDSGVGGLSILKPIHAAFAHHDLIYVADSGHAPYGDRSPQQVIDRATAIARFLLNAGVEAIVVACNTASVLAIQQLRAMTELPVIAMEPAIKPAALASRSGVIGVLATANTVASSAVQRLCKDHGRGVRILLQACPGLAEQVERGDLHSTGLLQAHLQPLLAAGADHIVLGCTHYSFLLPLIQALVGCSVTVVEPSAAIARQLGRKLSPGPGSGRPASLQAYTSDPALLRAQALIDRLWHPAPTLRVSPLPV